MSILQWFGNANRHMMVIASEDSKRYAYLEKDFLVDPKKSWKKLVVKNLKELGNEIDEEMVYD